MILVIDFSWIYLFYKATNWHSIDISFGANFRNFEYCLFLIYQIKNINNKQILVKDKLIIIFFKTIIFFSCKTNFIFAQPKIFSDSDIIEITLIIFTLKLLKIFEPNKILLVFKK